MSNSAITFNTAGLASASSPGLVGTGAQTFAGKKTLDGGALIKGDTSGVAIASGYVGERIDSTQLAASVSPGSGNIPATALRRLSFSQPGIFYVVAVVTPGAPASGSFNRLRIYQVQNNGTGYGIASDLWITIAAQTGTLTASGIFHATAINATTDITIDTLNGSLPTGSISVTASWVAFRIA